MKYHLFIVFAYEGRLWQNMALNLPKDELLIYTKPYNDNFALMASPGRVVFPSQVKKISILASQFEIEKDYILPNGKKFDDDKNIDYIVDSLRKVKGINEITQDFISPAKKF